MFLKFKCNDLQATKMRIPSNSDDKGRLEPKVVHNAGKDPNSYDLT